MGLPSHLIIPDAHCRPGLDNKRFKALGRYIADRQPETIICLGDFADMASLSHYDKGKLSGEGRRYKDDISAVSEAMAKLFTPVIKVKGYQPKLIMCLGNHEDRINRAIQDDPVMAGKIAMEDLQYERFGWEVHPFQEVVVQDSISYSHFFATGVSGRPVSGESIGKTLCNKNHCSSVQGHSHVFDHSERSRVDGNKMFGLSAGWYGHPDMREGWNRATMRMWWAGVVLLEDVDKEGYYDAIYALTQRKLLRDYA